MAPGEANGKAGLVHCGSCCERRLWRRWGMMLVVLLAERCSLSGCGGGSCPARSVCFIDLNHGAMSNAEPERGGGVAGQWLQAAPSACMRD
jgi:hypothetical protein